MTQINRASTRSVSTGGLDSGLRPGLRWRGDGDERGGVQRLSKTTPPDSLSRGLISKKRGRAVREPLLRGGLWVSYSGVGGDWSLQVGSLPCSLRNSARSTASRWRGDEVVS